MSTHVARIAKIDAVQPIPNADRIQTAFVLGNQVIVGKDSNIGDLGVFFDCELQLDQLYCSENNLFRNKELNKDKQKSGYLEENRRIRTQKFLKVKSEGLFMPISSLGYADSKLFKVDANAVKLGDAFDEINGIKICQKYISEKTRRYMESNRVKKPKSVEAPLFIPHVDSENIKYYWESIPVGALVTLTSKSHGTSSRYSYSTTYRTLPYWKQWINKLYPIFSNESWEYLCGSRRVVLFEENAQKEGFHGSERFRFDWLEKLRPYLDKNMVIYGELVGYANDKPIMAKHDISILKDKKYEEKYGKGQFVYKYGCLENTNDFLIYRIAYVSPSGKTLDFTWPQIKKWCEKTGFKCVKEIEKSFIYDGNLEALKTKIEYLTERPDKLTEDYIDPSHISEGLVIRVDTDAQTPFFYKSKSYCFRVCEGLVKEQEVDIEDAS